MNRRTLLIPLVLAAATLAIPLPAQATSANHNDPTGDAAGAKDPRADVTVVDISYTGGTITVGAAVVNPETPTTRNWTDGDSAVIWTLFHPNGQEYEVNFSPFNDGLYGSVFDPQDKHICQGQSKATFGADKRYVVSFPASCLGDPAHLTVTVEFTYDDIAAGKGKTEDVAPDNEVECCRVTPS